MSLYDFDYDASRPVWVYRNLRAHKYSVMQCGRVVGHASTVRLTDCRFVVRAGSRARVLQERRKNVHAFVVGWLRASTFRKCPVSQVTYNPYRADCFVDGDGCPVATAGYASLTDLGVFCAEITYEGESANAA